MTGQTAGRPVPTKEDSVWRLRSDLLWARALLWMARSGQGGREPRRGVHLFLADRYGRLARHCSARGAHVQARRLERRFAFHYRAGSRPGGPDSVASAMAMAVPPEPPEDALAPGTGDGSAPDDAA